MEPYALLPPTTPSTLHVTPVFELPLTFAAYCDEVPNVTLIAPLNVNVTGGAATGAASATASVCETDGSATLVAVMFTFDHLLFIAGAA
jgi:hypothetical protein